MPRRRDRGEGTCTTCDWRTRDTHRPGVCSCRDSALPDRTRARRRPAARRPVVASARRVPRRRVRPAPPTTSTASSARSPPIRPRSGPVARTRAGSAARPGSTTSCRCRGSRSSRGARASRVRSGDPEREWNGPVRGWQQVYREGIAALGDDLDLDAAARAATARVRARVRSVVRRAGVRRQPRPRRLAHDRIRGRRAATRAGATRRSPVPEFDVVVIGSGPGGATAADVLTEAGRSVCVLEKGRNHLLSLDAPFDGLGHQSNDEVKFGRRHFLGPDPLLEPRSYRRSVADGERTAVGDVNNMPSTVGGAGFHADGKLPRYREVDFRLLSELGPVEGAAVADWPVDYDGDGAVLRRGRTDHRRRRRRRRQPLRRVAGRSVPHAAGRRHVPHHADRARVGAPRLPPVPRAHRRQQRGVRRAPGVQQLRVLRVLRVSDRGQGRPGGDVAPRARSAARARSVRRAWRWRSCSMPAVCAPRACATSMPPERNRS